MSLNIVSDVATQVTEFVRFTSFELLSYPFREVGPLTWHNLANFLFFATFNIILPWRGTEKFLTSLLKQESWSENRFTATKFPLPRIWKLRVYDVDDGGHYRQLLHRSISQYIRIPHASRFFLICIRTLNTKSTPLSCAVYRKRLWIHSLRGLNWIPLSRKFYFC